MYRNMTVKPLNLREILANYENINVIYEAMKKEDLADVVIQVMKFLNQEKTLNFFSIVNAVKSEKESNNYRSNGNAIFETDKFQDILMSYNKAILYAPKDSKAIKLALSNRSALLMKIKAYNACLKDIETCFMMGCPTNVIEKLKKRKEEASVWAKKETKSAHMHNICAEAFLLNNFRRNSEVKCVSRNVKFIGSITPKVVAAREIQPGTVVSYEQAYVTYSEPDNALFTCYYCQKMSLNLLPCDNCCVAMFCSQDCKSECYEEYHKYECQIVDAVKAICNYPLQNLLVKMVFKIRSKCKSWKEIIEASKKLGLDRMQASSNEEIFDSDYIFSCLNIRDDRPFIHGSIYNGSILCATLLKCIEKIPSFYPENRNDRDEAIKAIARIMLFIYVYQTTSFTYQSVTNVIDNTHYIHNKHGSGIYSFAGKLKSSCNPNLFAATINNNLMLIAIQTIKLGEELTLCKPLHFHDSKVERRVQNISNFLFYGNVCDCAKCKRNASSFKHLSETQKKYYENLKLSKFDHYIDVYQMGTAFYKLLDAMDVLNNVCDSQEYKEVYKRFRTCVSFYEATKGENFVLS